MREAENIRQVAKLDINWMGFIFYSKSPRQFEETGHGELTLSPFHSQPLIADRQPGKVGVFVNATPGEMIEKAKFYHLDYLQLHGNESPDICHTLQKRGFSIIKAFSIATEEDLKQTKEYEGRAEYFLFDTKCSEYGGSGKSFDWSVLAAYNGKTPFLLSGGINSDSVEAIRNFQHPRLAGIDLNSGFEISPGLKNIGKLKIFIDELNRSSKNQII